jgi:hypothetical protein
LIRRCYVDVDIEADIAADRAAEKLPARRTLGHRAPGRQGVLPGGAGDGSGPLAQRLRCWQREPSDGPTHDRTLRHPPRHERGRVAGHDGHAADATDPDHRREANVDSDSDVDFVTDVGHIPNDTDDLTPDVSRNLTPNVSRNITPNVSRNITPRPHLQPPPTSTSTPSASGTATSAKPGGLGVLGWTLLIVLVAGLIAAWLIWRSRRKSAWDAEAGALEMDTRTTAGTRLPLVLTAETAAQRALSWPPLRAALTDLIGRWDLLVDRASDDLRRNRSVQIRGLLQELVAAVDAENEALATGRDWRLLRPRVDEVRQALSAVLAGGPQQEPPAGWESGQPTPGE